MTRPRAVLFDLLTALINSWSLWDRVAGEGEGYRWRAAYLRNTYATAAYRPYEALVREAAVEVGLPSAVADRLIERYGELEPWPEVADVLGALAGHVPLAVVTNCSEDLGRIAAGAGRHRLRHRRHRRAGGVLQAAPAPLPAGPGSPRCGTGRRALRRRVGLRSRRRRCNRDARVLARQDRNGAAAQSAQAALSPRHAVAAPPDRHGLSRLRARSIDPNPPSRRRQRRAANA